MSCSADGTKHPGRLLREKRLGAQVDEKDDHSERAEEKWLQCPRIELCAEVWWHRTIFGNL